jgi:hypothetical protein
MNALYVYEAQMSLLVRVAQSRQGADRLQELQIIPILAQAQYIGSRPEGLSSPDGQYFTLHSPFHAHNKPRGRRFRAPCTVAVSSIAYASVAIGWQCAW